jgi:hypothetical protein
MYTIKDNILTFDEEFNQSIDNIIFPDAIVSIIFNWKFNQPLDKVIFPRSLKKIELNYSFNQSLDKVKFPELLESIIMVGPLPFNFIKNANFMKFIKNIDYDPRSFYGCQPHELFNIVDIKNDNIESISIDHKKIPLYDRIISLKNRIKALESKDFNSEMTKLKSENDQLKEKIDIMTEEINQIKRNNERFDAMDKYYRDHESYITQLLDINIKNKEFE